MTISRLLLLAIAFGVVSCTHTPIGGTGCGEAGPCSAGQICVDDTCHLTCNVDAQCSAGEMCREGACFEVQCDDGSVGIGTLENCSECGDACLAGFRVATGECDTTGASPRCVITGCDPGWIDRDGEAGSGCEAQCTVSHGGVELCDGQDNDCDGTVDDVLDIDVECNGLFVGVEVASWLCLSGSCAVGSCALGFWDDDGVGANGCEYSCTLSNDGAETCDGLDNDCDGLNDNLADVNGDCSSRFPAAADVTGWACLLSGCDIVGCTPGLSDVDNDPATGCEASCMQSNGGVEICDGVDNDCDGTTDNGFVVGTACGVGACLGGQMECLADGSGSVCSTESGGSEDRSSADICDYVDNDCDGTVDNVFNVGQGCGVETCAGGVYECLGDGSGTRCSNDGQACGDGICNECREGVCSESLAGAPGPGCSDSTVGECTAVDTCEAGGVCNANDVVDGSPCGDMVCNECTSGSCQDSAVGAPGPGCTDTVNDGCTSPDTCGVGGVCDANHAADGTACWDMVCNECVNGACSESTAGMAGPGCSDPTNNDCTTADTCEAGGLCNRHDQPNGTACGDHVCNECGGGACLDSAAGGPGPGCNDATASDCTAPDTCAAGGLCNVNHTADGTACGDGICNVCGTGACVESSLGVAGPGCDDPTSDGCTAPDICLAGGVCDRQHRADGTACGDLVCNECGGGVCVASDVGSAGPGCADITNDTCTGPDACDAAGVCNRNHTANGTSCGDGVCNECGSGVCVDSAVGVAGPGCSAPTSDDCTLADLCAAGGVCDLRDQADGTVCGDLVCNECLGGACGNSPGGVPGPGCTASSTQCTGVELCDGSGTCNTVDPPDGSPCDADSDLEKCDDSCQGGACIADSPASAGLPCGSSATTGCTNPDTCDGGGSCEPNHVVDGTACGDGICNECGGGVCVESVIGSPGPGCTDGTSDDCTAPDTCAVGGVCSSNHSPNAIPCGDGVCNECNAGMCVESALGVQGPGCTDTTNDDCTSPDTCVAGGLCNTNHEADGTACWDMVCNECVAGACGFSPVGFSGPGCADATADDCTVPDTCGPGGVCNANHAANGTACGDLVCNECLSGSCGETASGSPGPGCDDTTNDTCTDPDTCEAGGVCNERHEADSTACGDMVCNECGSGVCVASAVGSAGPGCNDGTDNTCTGPDTCAAGGICAANHAPDSTACGDLVCNECATGVCVESVLGSPGPGCNNTDNTLCTGPDTCTAGGLCNVNHAADGTACGDMVCNECGVGVCVTSAVGLPGPGCDDTTNDTCTAPDVCSAGGACDRSHTAEGTACGDLVCNECATGVCVDSAVGSPGPGCDDATNDTCTAPDACIAGGACNRNHAANGAPCGDLVCNECGAGVCVSSTVGFPGPGCSDLATNDCTTPDTCDAGGVCNLHNQANGTACGDGVCNECGAGVCVDSTVGAAGPGCSDLTSDDCTTPDTCDPGGVCDLHNQGDGTGCGDGVCNECNAGVCSDSPGGVQGPGCNAGASTCSGVETCDGAGSCQSADPPDGTPCDGDSDLNTCDDSCQGGACVSGTSASAGLPCGSSASTTCTSPDTCDGGGVCQPNHAANGTACGDLICNECTSGSCVETLAGTAGPGCADAVDDDCTHPDTCVAGGLCAANHVADTTPCGDGVCNECNAGSCLDSAAGQPGPGCDSIANNDCTAPDTCAAGGVCNTNHASDGTACWDRVCNQCTGGACGDSPVGTAGPGCTDATNDTCTAPDTCAAGGICLANHAANGTACGDGVCNECSTGACLESSAGSSGPGCDSTTSNTCTGPDSCMAGGVCNLNHATDGIACGDMVCNECGTGVCVASAVGVAGPGCSDSTNNTCTTPDTCDAGGVCNPNHAANGTACGDGVCNECSTGACASSAVGSSGPGCNDATDDTCTAPDTCVAGGICNPNHFANGTACGDGVCNECGTGVCVASTVGIPGPGCFDVTSNTCTAPDTCAAGGVCNLNHAADGIACGDLVCNECGSGVCVDSTVGSAGPGCTDVTTDLCTAPDTCAAGGVCDRHHTADGTACGDLVCNQCSSGTCVNSPGGVQGPGCAAGATTCAGVETCDGVGACQSADPPNGTPCDADNDTNVCDDSCQAGACIADVSATINQPCGDASDTTCTNPDTCNGSGACQGNHAGDGTACGDMICNECGTGVCVESTVGASGPGCNNTTNGLCTAPDTCEVGGVCNANHSANGTACGDLVCNECNSGVCVDSAAGVAGVGCNSSTDDDCTAPDVCLAGGVCNPQHSPDGTACWDMVCNECTAGACGDSSVGSSGPGCNDATSNLCTAPDTCGTGGVCAANHSANGTACGDLVCNECATGACATSAVGVAGPGCSDATNDTCTASDTCAAGGACNPNHVVDGTACGDLECDECGTGVCVETTAGSPGPGCNDGANNICTAPDVCTPGGICDEQHAADGLACGDLVCNECAVGICVSSPAASPGPGCSTGVVDCASAEVCNGSGGCTQSTEPDGTSCDADSDTNFCDDSCQFGICEAGTAAAAGEPCGDAVATDCTNPDSCDGAGACGDNHQADSTACGDMICNECATGVCVDSTAGSSGPGCSDATNDDCTAPDTCELGGVCDEHHMADATACGDLVCNQCSAGLCVDSAVGVAGPGCNNGTNDDCTAPDTCAAGGLCNPNHAVDGTACWDKICNQCTAGACGDSPVGAPGPGCTDVVDTICTDPDTCAAGGFCSPNHAPDNTPCGDLVCNECATGACVDSPTGIAGPDCADAADTDCTDPQTCEAGGVCDDHHEPNATFCSDGLFCNGDETCDGAGVCGSSDGDPCLVNLGDADNDCTESCDEDADDCTAPDPDASLCDDGFACTDNDGCLGGVCLGTEDDAYCDTLLSGDLCRPACFGGVTGCGTPPSYLDLTCTSPVTLPADSACTVDLDTVAGQLACLNCAAEVGMVTLDVADFSDDMGACSDDGWQLVTGGPNCSLAVTGCNPMPLSAPCCEEFAKICTGMSGNNVLRASELVNCAPGREQWRLYKTFDTTDLTDLEVCFKIAESGAQTDEGVMVYASDMSHNVQVFCLNGEPRLGAVELFVPFCASLPSWADDNPELTLTFVVHSDDLGDIMYLDDIVVHGWYETCAPAYVTVLTETFDTPMCPNPITDGWNGWDVAGTPNCPGGFMCGNGTNSAEAAGDKVTFLDDFETDKGWTVYGGAGEWERGPPGGGPDPAAAYSGSNVLGNDLGDNYENNIGPTSWITSPAIDCSGLSNTRLRFRRWLNIEGVALDRAYIEVSNDGTNWNPVWQVSTAPHADTVWTLATHTISATADDQPTVYIRFGIDSNAATVYGGWNIDDVSIIADDIWTLSRVVDASALDGDVRLCFDYGDNLSNTGEWILVEIDTGTGPQTVWNHQGDLGSNNQCDPICVNLSYIDPAVNRNPALWLAFSAASNSAGDKVELDNITLSGAVYCDGSSEALLSSLSDDGLGFYSFDAGASVGTRLDADISCSWDSPTIPVDGASTVGYVP